MVLEVRWVSETEYRLEKHAKIDLRTVYLLIKKLILDLVYILKETVLLFPLIGNESKEKKNSQAKIWPWICYS